MKKYWIAALIIVLCLSAAIVIGIINDADRPLYDYKLIHQDGKYYIQLSRNYLTANEPGNTAGTSSDLSALQTLTFDSIDDMVSHIRSGNFSNDQFRIISKFTKDTKTGLIPIVNLDEALLAPVYPECVSDCKVSWAGKSYSFYFLDDNGKTVATFASMSEEAFHSSITGFRDFSPKQLIRYTYDESSGTKVYEYMRGDVFIRDSFTIKELPDKSLYLKHSYEKANEIESERIDIYAEENGRYYRINIYQADMFSQADIAQFGIKEYVENK